MDLDRRLRALKVALVLTGGAFAIGVPVLTNVWPDAWMWEPRQSEYEQMIVGIYVTLGVFVLLAARNPLQHLSLIGTFRSPLPLHPRSDTRRRARAAF